MDDAIFETKRLAGISDAKIVTYARPSEYKSNIYSSASFNIPSTVNLINIDAGSLIARLNISFMYLWMP